MRSSMTRFLLIILSITLTAHAAFAQQRHIEKSLERIKSTTLPSPESFDFIVVGDSNSLEPLVQPDVFKQSIAEFNILKPDLVVEVGDLVLAGSAAPSI